MELLQHTVGEADEDIRLDRWFKRHHPGFPHALLEKNLRKGLIRLDGKKAKSSDRLHTGQELRYPPVTIVDAPQRKFRPSEQDLAEIRKWVLYKDENIIVINKPFGLAVQGGSKVTKSVDDLLDGLAFDGERPKLTHRLDRDTSGCLLLARNAKVATKLMRFFSTRAIDKTYLALVSGLPQPFHGTIDLAIRKKDNPKASGIAGGPEGRDYEVMRVDEEEGQKAVTDYRVIEHLSTKFSVMELKPLTGRTHQLRVHMQAIGCPIVGDHKYGGSVTQAESIGVEDILHLHAWHIAIPPLAGNKKIEVTAPLPTHIRRSFEALCINAPKR